MYDLLNALRYEISDSLLRRASYYAMAELIVKI